MSDDDEIMIAKSIDVSYFPSPKDLPHGVVFRFATYDGEEMAFFLPCAGQKPSDIKAPFDELVSAIKRLCRRELNS